MMQNYVLVEKIIKYADKNPEQLAIADNSEYSLTYRQFVSKIRCCAKYLKEQGVIPETRVMIEGVSTNEYVISYFAVHMLGAVAVPFEKNKEQKYLNYVIEHVGATYMLLENERQICDNIVQLNMKDAVNHPVEYTGEVVASSDKIADILFTTGTTGNPKGVIMTHKNICKGAENVACGVEMTSKDVDMVVAPMNHAYAMGCLRAVMLSGAGIVLHESYMNFKEMMIKLRNYRCTGFSCVPATIKMIYELSRGSLDRVFEGMRYIELGSSSLDKAMKMKILEQLPNVHLYLNYGSTEAPRNIYMDLCKNPDKINSIGQAAVNATVHIMNEDGLFLPRGKENVGRLVIEGEMVMPGYWEDEEQSNQVLDGNCFFTNDMGYMDEDGFVFLLGRRNDLLNIGGELISPLEIESVANSHENVVESACIGVCDDGVLGEKIILFVQVKDTSIPEEGIRRCLEKNLETVKIPDEIRYIDKIPTNYLGKIDRKQLKMYI